MFCRVLFNIAVMTDNSMITVLKYIGKFDIQHYDELHTGTLKKWSVDAWSNHFITKYNIPKGIIVHHIKSMDIPKTLNDMLNIATSDGEEEYQALTKVLHTKSAQRLEMGDRVDTNFFMRQFRKELEQTQEVVQV